MRLVKYVCRSLSGGVLLVTSPCLFFLLFLSPIASQVTKKDFTTFDHILCMDESNYQDLLALQRKASSSHGSANATPNATPTKAVVRLFGEFDRKGEQRIIQDPYYGGEDGFEVNFQQCLRAAHGFLDSLGFGGK